MFERCHSCAAKDVVQQFFTSAEPKKDAGAASGLSGARLSLEVRALASLQSFVVVTMNRTGTTYGTVPTFSSGHLAEQRAWRSTD